MQFLRDMLDKQAHHFEKGGKLERLHPVWEAQDTILFTPGLVTRGAAHVRDALDQKRMMITVVVALIPCILMACFNTGYQANVAVLSGATALDDWHTTIYQTLGFTAGAEGSDSFFTLSNFFYGFLFFFPAWVVTMTAGGIAEVVFSVIRRHPVTEGFLVTGMLIPLIMPPSIPLWQVAVATLFGIIIGKEIFGGVGMNILNPALTARAFLFFAYPAQISGDGPWLPFQPDSVENAANGIASLPDAHSGATYLSLMANQEGFVDALPALGSVEWMSAFLGTIPGSMGETSALACLIGAAILIFTKIGSWRTMVGIIAGTVVMALLLNVIGSETNAMFHVPFYWHFVVGGWAFGTVFMATDPVSSPFSKPAKLAYGFSIGVLVVLVRCINPAYAEGMMLAILFMNMFAPLYDYFVVEANIRRRMKRSVV
ncbi:MAG: Na+-transporting NADH:ubiquinone oxidoreductase subunit B [Myxococcota bacterium]|jgi:Na+-transporting NADH:ubiquinone oxidoreductase subunit B